MNITITFSSYEEFEGFMIERGRMDIAQAAVDAAAAKGPEKAAEVKAKKEARAAAQKAPEPKQEAPAPARAATEEPKAVSQQDLAVAGVALVDAGKLAEVQQVLKAVGIASIPEATTPELIAKVAEGFRALGGDI